jgi:hypothetical protein
MDQEADTRITDSERAQLLEFTTQLEQPELSLDARLNIATQMRQVLTIQSAFSLPMPAFAESAVT